MLVCRVARSTGPVKVTLFKSLCPYSYTYNLWVSCKQKINTLRVHYNNAFRVLLKLPWCFSASGMFEEADTDGFYAFLRSASLFYCIGCSTNDILRVGLRVKLTAWGQFNVLFFLYLIISFCNYFVFVFYFDTELCIKIYYKVF